MLTFSWVHWALFLLMLSGVVPVARILNRLGLSPLWAALYFVPVVNVIALWTLARVHWPHLPERATGPLSLRID